LESLNFGNIKTIFIFVFWAEDILEIPSVFINLIVNNNMEVLGIDIGGSGMKAAVVNIETGELITERYRIDTPIPRKPEAMAEVVQQLVEHFNWQGPIGCTFPTIVIDGVCKSQSNLDASWVDVNIEQLFSEKCGGLPFYVANDADLAGFAEMKMGIGKDKNGSVILITIGTGLGAGFFYDGQLIPNFELGAMFHTDGEIIEKYASDAAKKRDGIKTKEWAVRFDFFLNHLNRVFSPNLIIIGGGQSKKFDKFKDILTVPVEVVPAKFLNFAGIIGAAMWASLND
jgi:polyphosphate glucokinase